MNTRLSTRDIDQHREDIREPEKDSVHFTAEDWEVILGDEYDEMIKRFIRTYGE
ncbi:hypothetical protein KAR91_39090 [Candidatus Pacearchaeota archaeon]|nr:hypothetical protein [Candidatus Pacearchaeota archaeon]